MSRTDEAMKGLTWPPVIRYLREPATMAMDPNDGRLVRVSKGRPYGMVVGYRKGMVGWCLCHPKDTFSKITGRMICYNRAGVGVLSWRSRLMRQALRSHGVSQDLAYHFKWDAFQRMCPRMARIIMLIEEVEDFLSNPGKDS